MQLTYQSSRRIRIYDFSFMTTNQQNVKDALERLSTLTPLNLHLKTNLFLLCLGLAGLVTSLTNLRNDWFLGDGFSAGAEVATVERSLFSSNKTRRDTSPG